MELKKLSIKLLVSWMLILSSTQAQDIDSSSVDTTITDRTCQLQHPVQCIEEFQVMNQSLDMISLYLDGILKSLESDSLQP